MEVFKTIKGFENYEISNLGNVKSLNYNRTKKEKLLKKCNDSDGYEVVILCNKLGKKTLKVHRLVALHFIDNEDNKKEVNHINGIKTDNRIENLEWCTASENQIHAYKIGLQINPKRKLTLQQVEYIRQNCRKKYLINNIPETVIFSQKYNVSVSTINKILRNYSYKKTE
jgi:hypothetical protein